MSKKLVVTDGTRERELQIVGTLVVGRDPACDITYDDALLSRRHAEFVTAGDHVTVRDLGSRNGVFVNGAKIAERLLRSGDVVQIGPVRALYVADVAPVSIAPEGVDADYTAVLHRDAPVTAPPPVSAPVPVAFDGHDMGDDDDRTQLLSAPRARQTPDSTVRQAPGPAPAIGDDDERTLFLRTPAPSAPPPASAQSRPTSGTSVLPPPASRPGVRPLPTAGSQPVAPPQPVARDPQPPMRAPQPVIRSSESAIRNPPSAIGTPQPAIGTPQLAIGTPQPTTRNPQPTTRNPQSAIRNPQSAIRNSLATFVFVQVLALAAIVLFASAIPLIVWRRAALSGVDQAAASAPIVWLALPVAVAVVAAYYVSTLITRRFVHALAEVEQSRT